MIRSASRDDIDAIRALARASWIETYSEYLGEEAVRTHVDSEDFYAPATLRQRVTEDNGVVLVADDPDSGVVGYCYLTWETGAEYLEDGDADLRHIYLHPSHYGRGLGSKLLTEGIDRLPAEIHRLVVLFHPKNDGARRFYEATGFSVVGSLDLDPTKVGMPSTNVDPPEMYARSL